MVEDHVGDHHGPADPPNLLWMLVWTQDSKTSLEGLDLVHHPVVQDLDLMGHHLHGEAEGLPHLAMVTVGQFLHGNSRVPHVVMAPHHQ